MTRSGADIRVEIAEGPKGGKSRPAGQNGRAPRRPACAKLRRHAAETEAIAARATPLRLLRLHDDAARAAHREALGLRAALDARGHAVRGQDPAHHGRLPPLAAAARREARELALARGP